MENVNQPELPAILKPDNQELLLSQMHKAGEHNLDPVQIAAWLKIPVEQLRLAMYMNSELDARYQQGKLQWSMEALNIIKDVAMDSSPENKQRLAAAKYLYELFTGYSNGPKMQSFVAIQNYAPQLAKTESNIKLLEALDVETIKAIEED